MRTGQVDCFPEVQTHYISSKARTKLKLSRLSGHYSSHHTKHPVAKSLPLPASALPVDVAMNKIYTHSPTHPSRYVCSEDAVNDGCEPDVVLGS